MVSAAGTVAALRQAALLLGCVALLLPCPSGEIANHCTPEQLSRFQGWPQNLDVGIYWFGHGDQARKAVSGSKSEFYDPAKKTMIFFHGWTGKGDGWTVNCKRSTTRCPGDVCPEESGVLLMEGWLDAGWNVGIFYWDQFADEDCTRDAEQKIWFDRKGDGFRWKSFSMGTQVATYQNYKEDAISMADLCVKHMRMAMGEFKGPNVRFVGHNIGAQLATRCAALLHMENHPAAPQRLALLEPYFSKHHMYIFRCQSISTSSGLGDFTAQATAMYVKSLWTRYKVVTEIYKSSVLTELDTFGVPNEELEHLGTLVEFQPDWCGGLGPLTSVDVVHLKCRTVAVFPMYFLGLGQPAPPVYPVPQADVMQPGSALSTCVTPSAGCSDGQIAEWVERQLYVQGRQKWKQSGGKGSFDRRDDEYSLVPSLQEEQQLGAEAANVLVMRAAPTDEEAAKERLQDPLWRELLNDERVLVAVPISLTVLILACIGCAVHRHFSDSGDESDGDGDMSLISGGDPEEDPVKEPPSKGRRGARSGRRHGGTSGGKMEAVAPTSQDDGRHYNGEAAP